MLRSVCFIVAPACNRVRRRRPLFRPSSKFDIYVKVSILINYKTKQPSYLARRISLTSWLQVPWPGDFDLYFALQWLTQFTSTFQIFSTIRPTTTKPCIVLLLDVVTRQVPWPDDLDLYFALQWLWHILRRRVWYLLNYKAIKPCIVLFLDVLTRQIPWPCDLDLYFVLQWLWHNLRQRSRSPQV